MKTDVKQHDITDCGAACICSIARHYGKEIPLSIVRESSGTNELGTSIKGMLDALHGIGFEAKGYSSSERDVEALRRIPLPAILHTISDKGDLHFAVLYGCGKKKVTLMDPAKGRHVKLTYNSLHDIWSGHLICLQQNPSIAPDPGDSTSQFSNHLIFRYFRIACLSKRDLLLSLPGSFFSVIAGIGIALYIQNILDVVIPTGDVRLCINSTATIFALVCCSAIVTLLSSLFALRAGVRIDANLIIGYLRHLFSLSPSFFWSRSAGELNSRVTDAMKIRRLITESIPGALTGTLLLAGAVTLMFTTHKHLAFIALVFVPIYLALTLVALKVSRSYNRRVVESAAQFERRCVESISSVRTVKYFGWGEPSANAEKEYLSLSWNLFRNGRAAVLFGSGAELLSKLLAITIVAGGAWFIMRSSLSIGELVAFYALTGWFAAPLAETVRLGIEINEANLSLERLDDIMVMKSEQERGQSSIGMEDMEMFGGEPLRFDKVEFAYPGCPTLLHCFDLTIPAGKITAITGESGCGKSTIAAMLMRDISPGRGHILLGMNDISLFDLERWREFVSIVPQEPALLGCSILDNITGGEKNPNLRRVAAILDQLGMKEFITSLPLGMLTPVGEFGSLLSGGQKQRVAMARAIWRNPQVLILDEATASLDSESQQYILRSACRMRDEGKTVIMITHRKDNTEIADLIFHMEGESAHP